MENNKGQQVQNIADAATDIIQLLPGLDTLIDRLTKAKTLTNNLRWRIGGATGGPAPAKPGTFTDPATKAKGVTIPFTTEVFYNVYMAAKLLKTNAASIQTAIDTEQLYTLQISGAAMIPQGVLLMWNKTRQSR